MIKMSRVKLERIIREELAARIEHILLEKEGEAPEVEDAEDSSEEKPEPADKQADDEKDAAGPGGDEEKPAGDDPSDDDLDKQAADDEEDAAGPAETEKLGDQLVGKTIQSVTANPKSKLMPGAMEIVVQFDQIPDPLKILITKTGAVKYFFRGLHNEI